MVPYSHYLEWHCCFASAEKLELVDGVLAEQWLETPESWGVELEHWAWTSENLASVPGMEGVKLVPAVLLRKMA